MPYIQRHKIDTDKNVYPVFGLVRQQAASAACVPQHAERFKMKYFGTDGFRGKANEVLTADHAFNIGKFLGWYFTDGARRKASCVIGKDTRRSSYMFEYALAAGLSSGRRGCEPAACHYHTECILCNKKRGF